MCLDFIKPSVTFTMVVIHVFVFFVLSWSPVCPVLFVFVFALCLTFLLYFSAVFCVVVREGERGGGGKPNKSEGHLLHKSFTAKLSGLVFRDGGQ